MYRIQVATQYLFKRFYVLINKALPKRAKDQFLILQSFGTARFNRPHAGLKSANRNIVQGELSLF
jgi:hypothetical protein